MIVTCGVALCAVPCLLTSNVFTPVSWLSSQDVFVCLNTDSKAQPAVMGLNKLAKYEEKAKKKLSVFATRGKRHFTVWTETM